MTKLYKIKKMPHVRPSPIKDKDKAGPLSVKPLKAILTPYNATLEINVNLLPTLSAKYPPKRAPIIPPIIWEADRNKYIVEELSTDVITVMFFVSVTFKNANNTQGASIK
jgi:hypothetical protein